MKIIIDDPFVGKTVKDILISHLGLSRGQISFLKRSGGIRVNSQEVTVRYMLSLSDELELDLEDKAEDINPMIEPVFHELDILYEDTDIICINKPSGMATHPSHNHHGDTRANALVYYYKEKGKPFVFRAVNRLDRETSGVVLIAKNRASAARLSLALKHGEFVKHYSAIVCGHPESDRGVVEKYITRCEDSIIFRKAVDIGIDSEYAKTEYETVCSFKDYSLLDVTPITGRTHQIRVHMASIGVPIYGDGLYGNVAEEGLMLHASSLEFPINNSRRITISASLPDRFIEFRRKNEI